MNIRPYKNLHPELGKRVYIDPQATLIGDVKMGDDASLWPQSVCRGDVNRISIGQRTNVQDGSVLHVTHAGPYSGAGKALLIGDDVTIGHQVMLHGCTIGHRVLIGMKSLVLDGVQIEDQVILGAGSLVTQDKVLESGYLWHGRPAKKIRPLTEKEQQMLCYMSQHYVRLKDNYLE